MRYLELLKDLQNLTNEKLTDRRMMEAFNLKTPSAITYKKQIILSLLMTK